MKETLKGLVTHYSFDHNDENYKLFLDLRKKSKSVKNPDKLKKTAEEYFFDFIKDYIKTLELTPESVYIREKNEIDLYLKEIEILNQREDHADGYVPEIKFTATEKKLTAKGNLRKTGVYYMAIFSDFLKLAFKNKIPKLEFEDELIQTAPISQIPRVIDSVKKTYESIKGNKLDELIQLYDGLEKLKSEDKCKLAENIIQKEYDQRIRLLLPNDL